MYTINYVIFSGLKYFYTMHQVFLSRGKYYLYNALRSIFEGYILFVFRTTQYFRGVHTIYILYYAVFSGGPYSLYIMHYAIFSGVKD